MMGRKIDRESGCRTLFGDDVKNNFNRNTEKISKEKLSDDMETRRSGRSRAGIAMLILVFAIAASLFSMRSEAASATLSISATGAEVGETVSVTVTAKSSDYIGYVYVILNYDSSILQAPTSDYIGGGSGTITFMIGSDSADVKEASFTVSFTALKAGTSSLTFDSGTWGIDNDGNDLTLSTSNSSVTVTAAYTASTDATLSALKVTGTTSGGSSSTIPLSPSFSKNTTSYTATVESNIATAVTTATANDSKATVSISNASLSLKTGTNTVTVKVTAESGATNTYTITITKKEAQTTTQAPTTTEATTTEEPTTEETITEEETTEEETTEAEEPITVSVGGTARILLAEFDESLLPEGFEMTEITWEGEVIQAGHGIYKDLTLVCTSDETGEDIQLYILQEDGSLLILRNYQAKAVLYTILELPDAEAPEGFQAAVLLLETDYASEDEVEAWQSIACPDYYLVYAMNWDGESGYYLYDSTEKTFQRYAEDVAGTEPANEETTAEETTAEETTTAATQTDATPTDDGTADGSASGIWKYIVMLLEAAVIVALAVLLTLAKRKGKGPGGGDLSEEDTGEDYPSGGGNVEGSKTQSGVEEHGNFIDKEAWSGEKQDGDDPMKNPEESGIRPGSPEGNDSSDEKESDGDTMSLKDYFSEFDAMLDELDESVRK